LRNLSGTACCYRESEGERERGTEAREREREEQRQERERNRGNLSGAAYECKSTNAVRYCLLVEE